MTKPMQVMQVKFCGLTRIQDVTDAVELGVDAIGLVFYPPSPRAITAEHASALVRHIASYVTVVALVVNMSETELVHLAQAVPFDVIQFHGDESPQDCQRLASAVYKRWYKALRVDGTTHTAQDVASLVTAYMHAGASSVLLDTYHKTAYGGTGERFDWSLIPAKSAITEHGSLILAGGLTPENVSEAIAHIKAYHLPVQAVDVSGGIESVKGVKDVEKMERFLKVIRS